jgi:hypothetical protein
MGLQGINDAKHWRDRASEMRMLCDGMKDAEARLLMLDLASITTSSLTERRIAPHATRRDLAPDRKTGSDYLRNYLRNSSGNRAAFAAIHRAGESFYAMFVQISAKLFDKCVSD